MCVSNDNAREKEKVLSAKTFAGEKKSGFRSALSAARARRK
jgi:hypothetical protein